MEDQPALNGLIVVLLKQPIHPRVEIPDTVVEIIRQNGACAPLHCAED
jgi:hypothetical protein